MNNAQADLIGVTNFKSHILLANPVPYCSGLLIRETLQRGIPHSLARLARS
jgi:hypothetical protein